MHGYDGKRVLITGGAGFLGSALAERLLTTTTAKVFCASRSTRPPLGATWQVCDVSDSFSCHTLFQRVKPDIVFHLTSEGRGAPAEGNLLPHIKNDVVATARCLLAAKTAGVERIVIPGSLEEPMPDETPLSPYAFAKSACVAQAMMAHQIWGLPVTVLRLFMTYGAGQHKDKVVPHIVRSMLKGVSPSLSSGKREVDWIYVDDATEAFMRGAVLPQTIGQVIEIGSGTLAPISRVAEIARALIPGAPAPTYGSHAEYGKAARAANLGPARLLMNYWEPTFSLEQGLAKMVTLLR